MPFRLFLATTTAGLLLILPGCSDSGSSSEKTASQAGTNGAQTGSQPSWALSPEEVAERDRAVNQKSLGPGGSASEEDVLFARIQASMQMKEQSHLIFVSATPSDLAELDTFLERYPESRHREVAMYMAAIGPWSSYNYAEAADRFGNYLEEFPKTRRSTLAKVRHAQAYVRSDQPELAIKSIDAHKSTTLAFQRELVRAEALALLGRFDEAKSLLRSWMVAPEAQEQQARTMFEARKLLERIESMNVAAPNFESYVYNTGEVVSRDTLLGKVVLIDFWKSTCNPCMSELPKITDLYDRYKSDGFEVLAVNMDNNINSMEQALEIIGSDWPVHHDGLGYDGEVAQLFGVTRSPHTVLIDRNGIIRAVDIRFDTLKRLVPELLAEPSTS